MHRTHVRVNPLFLPFLRFFPHLCSFESLHPHIHRSICGSIHEGQYTFMSFGSERNLDVLICVGAQVLFRIEGELWKRGIRCYRLGLMLSNVMFKNNASCWFQFRVF